MGYIVATLTRFRLTDVVGPGVEVGRVIYIHTGYSVIRARAFVQVLAPQLLWCSAAKGEIHIAELVTEGFSSHVWFLSDAMC